MRRYVSTETATSGRGPDIPPPGFNTNEAKKPIPRGVAPTKLTKGEIAVSTKSEKSEGLGGLGTAVAKPDAPEDTDTTAISATNEKSFEKRKEEKRTTVWQKVKHGVQHFWDGTKLLGAEIKISSNLALKMAAGYELSRRERRQVRSMISLPSAIPWLISHL